MKMICFYKQSPLLTRKLLDICPEYRVIICSKKRTVFRERSSKETVSFEEQIMFKDKYPSAFLSQKGDIVFITHNSSNIFRNTHIGEYHSDIPQF